VVACGLTEAATSTVTVMAGLAAAIVLVLREMRWPHPSEGNSERSGEAAEVVDPIGRIDG
jgi:hypothetical protein